MPDFITPQRQHRISTEVLVGGHPVTSDGADM